MKARPCWVGFGQSVPPRLSDSSMEETEKVIGIFCFFFGRHQTAILRAQTGAPAGRIGHTESGVGWITIKRVAAILKVHEAAARRGGRNLRLSLALVGSSVRKCFP